ncbi:DUF6622 family protein [Uliginosibacterium sediminicola]|uniref:DUF6622 family protein n=1 Tax=Uliginosibacterium sediminicola TaxID=2024550 RepID=A0ABU9Z272_9RHOO
MQEILSHTPIWVFGVLCLLLAFGGMQSFTRSLSVKRALIVPLAMSLWSLSLLMSRLAGSPAFSAAVLSWCGAVALSVLFSGLIGYPRGLQLEAGGRKVRVPGSLVPLVLMLMIFCARFISAVMLAREPAWRDSLGFGLGFSVFYGLISGVFLARALGVWRLLRRADAQAMVTA